MSTLPLILASGSPRRRDLLAQAGVAFEIMPADVPEERGTGEAPERFAARLAEAKAQAVADRIGSAPRRCVLGADTIVVLGDEVFGKPRDAEHAAELLGQLVGRTHRVITAVAVVASDTGVVHSCLVESRVAMRAASPAEIRAYVATGESLDKAGAYALQGEGRHLVEHVEGSETNVIGLPIDETLGLLARHAQPTAL
jgi:septum formation protein